jgi:hypothetical protein
MHEIQKNPVFQLEIQSREKPGFQFQGSETGRILSFSGEGSALLFYSGFQLIG